MVCLVKKWLRVRSDIVDCKGNVASAVELKQARDNIKLDMQQDWRCD